MPTNETVKLIYAAITQGLIIGFCTAAMIGPVNFLAIRRGILGGFQQTFLVGAGAAVMDALCAYAVFVGLAHEGFGGSWKFILFAICVIFLLYLAYSMLMEIRDSPEAQANSSLRRQVQWLDNSFVMGFILNATNPFTLLRWIGWVGTMQVYQYQVSGPIALMGGAATTFFSAVLVSELIWFFCLGMGVHYSRNLFNRKALTFITWICGLGLFFYYLFMATKVALNLIHTGGAPFH